GRHLRVWFAAAPPGGPRNNPVGYYGPPGSGPRGTRKREKPVARWTGAYLLLASALARHTPSLWGTEKETGRPQARPDLGPLKLVYLTSNMTNASVRAWHAPLPNRCRAEELRSARALEPDQRELPEGRHRAAFDEAHAAVTFGPARQPIPAEFRPPAEPPRERGEALLEGASHAGLGAEMIDQDDLAAGPRDAREFVHGLLRVGDRGDDILRDHGVEIIIGKAEL